MDHVRFSTDSLHVDHGKTSDGEPSRRSTNYVSTVTLDPMTRGDATKLVRRLLAGFPSLSAHDPEGYLAAMVQVMAEYPLWAGQRAVLKVDEAENCQFPPTDRTLRKWLEDAVRPYRFAAQWEAQTRKQLAERPPEDQPKRYLGTSGNGGAGTVYSNYDEAVARHGRPFGRFERERQLP